VTPVDAAGSDGVAAAGAAGFTTAGGGEGNTVTWETAGATSMVVRSISGGIAGSVFADSDFAVSDVVEPVGRGVPTGLGGPTGLGVAGSGESALIPRRAFSRFNCSSIRASCASTSAWLGCFAGALWF
jgi:hypothetical protein